MKSESQGNLRDITLTCCDCNHPFHFSIGEQVFFASKQLSQPKRCPSCRRKRRSTLVPDRQGMNFGRRYVPNGHDYTTIMDLKDGR
jgi:hypothetical protein